MAGRQHAHEEMQALVVHVEHLDVNAHRFALGQFSLIGDVRFKGEDRTLVLADIILAEPAKGNCMFLYGIIISILLV